MEINPIHLSKKLIASVLLMACTNLFIGCNVYKAAPLDAASVESKQSSLNELAGAGKYFILRKGSQSYAMSNIALNQGTMSLTASLGTVPAEHQLYIQAQGPPYKFSKKENQQGVLQEVHLFVSDNTNIDASGPYVLPLSNIQKIEVLGPDKKSKTLIFGLVTLGVVAAIILILGGGKSSPSGGGGSAPPPVAG